PGPQMRDLAQVLEAVALLLQREGRIGEAEHRDLARAQLEGLLLRGRGREVAVDLERAAGRDVPELRVARHRRVDDDLQRVEAGAAIRLDEGDVLALSDGPGPALHPDALGGLRESEDLSELHARRLHPPNLEEPTPIDHSARPGGARPSGSRAQG